MAPQRIVIAGGSGVTGRALGERLKGRCEVIALTTGPAPQGDAPGVAGLRFWQCDLTSIAEAEVALAGAEVLVCLARTARPPARLVHGAPRDLDTLLSDALAHAVPRTSVQRVVLWSTGPDDVRELTLRERGLPLVVLRGEGPEVVEALEALATAPHAADRQLAAADRSTPGEPRKEAQAWSIQRFQAPRGWTALDVARSYFEWLNRKVPSVSVSSGGDAWTLASVGMDLLTLRRLTGQVEPDSAVFTVCSGALVDGEGAAGRLEFRRLPSGEVVVALCGFAPRLPWLLYRFTQAVAHQATVTRFGQWLGAQPARA